MRNPADINVLLACEESQAVCIAFRERGFNAFSCDILPCSGGHPQWHIQADVLQVMRWYWWNCMIAFPPCTHLAVSGARHFEKKKQDGRQQQGVDFFMEFVKSDIKYKGIENPVGIMNSIYRKPDQIIQPYYFGNKSRKKTCLWLKNLPLLKYNLDDNLFEIKTAVEPELYTCKNGKTFSRDYMFIQPGETRGGQRSKTYSGIAKAMAEQWGDYLITQ